MMCGIANRLPITRVAQCTRKSTIDNTMTVILPQLFPLNKAYAIANSMPARIPTKTTKTPPMALGFLRVHY